MLLIVVGFVDSATKSIWPLLSAIFFILVNYIFSVKLCQPWNYFFFSPPAEFLRSGSLSCSRTVTLQSCTADTKLNAHSYFSDLSLIKVSRFACSTFSACQSFLKRKKTSQQASQGELTKSICLQIPVLRTVQVSDLLVGHYPQIKFQDVLLNSIFL